MVQEICNKTFGYCMYSYSEIIITLFTDWLTHTNHDIIAAPSLKKESSHKHVKKNDNNNNNNNLVITWTKKTPSS